MDGQEVTRIILEEEQNFLKDRNITQQFYEQRPKIQRFCKVREGSK
jgi:hypothetical protein